MDTLGDWSWPGQHRAGAVAEVLPPAWVPAFPPAAAPHEAAPPLPAAWQRGRRIVIAVLLSALAAVSAALALRHQLAPAPSAPVPARARAAAQEGRLLPAPALSSVHTDKAGSTILKASYGSIALHRPGGYYVYLPPSAHALTAAAGARYPVLYLLHGNSQQASAFLEIGVQRELDRLIATHRIPPLIAVMIQGGPGANNWRNLKSMRYESYVLEVQEIVDRTLPTIATRDARAIAGVSMGGYGSMELALNNPYRFGVVESWLGFFNGLEGAARLDRHAIASLGLHAFLYGGASDKIANPSEDAPFAALLRGAGADATGIVYPGEHSLETVQAHLPAMLTFAGAHLQASTASTARGAR
ncbi:MAG: alpha/beta hydrolase [Solirubrobacteraceae bacterium]